MAVAIQNGGVGTGTPLAPMGQPVANPYATAANTNTSPAAAYLANGGNPAMIQMYMQYLSTLPNGGAGTDPNQLYAQWKQGTGGDPASKGLTYTNGQFVDSTGNPYSNAAGQAAAQANSNVEWNTMFNKSNVYNNGGKLNVPTATNPTGFANVAHTTSANAPMPTPAAPAPARAPTPFEQSQTGMGYQGPQGMQSGDTTAPTPAPATPTPAPATPAPTQPSLNTGAQYTNNPQQNTANQPAMTNKTQTNNDVNPYAGQTAGNPYRFRMAQGWNV